MRNRARPREVGRGPGPGVKTGGSLARESVDHAGSYRLYSRANGESSHRIWDVALWQAILGRVTGE